jgi:hypothetical protein
VVSIDATVHMRDITREMGFKEEPAGINYQHPVICSMDIVEFPRGEEHKHTTTTKPERVNCGECLDRLAAYAEMLEVIDADN